MEKLLTLAEVTEMYRRSEAFCFETETSFGVNMFGKYRPNITFILPKKLNQDRNGDPIDPLSYIEDAEITDNMNINWGGTPKFMFGDYWRSRKGGACFRPKNPMQAKHLLIKVSWGEGRYGLSSEYSNEALYYRRASSNAGGIGNDYFVIPVGYKHSCYNPEIDGESNNIDDGNEVRAKTYCKKYGALFRARVEEEDKFLKTKAESEEKSANERATYEARLDSLVERLKKLRRVSSDYVYSLELGELYFKLGGYSYLYTAENVAKAQEIVADNEERVFKKEAKKKADAEAKAEFEPKFLELEQRFAGIGWRMETSATEVRVFEPYERSYGWNTFHEERKHEFPFSKEGFSGCKAMLESKETEIREKREAEEAAERLKEAQEQARAMGLPSNVRIWHRSGATNAGAGWVIMPNGMERDYDEIENPRRNYKSEGYGIWHQILPGELVISWAHACTAAEHVFEVIYCPEHLTEAQKELIVEIQNGLEAEFFGKAGLTGKYTCPSIGKGWNLI